MYINLNTTPELTKLMRFNECRVGSEQEYREGCLNADDIDYMPTYIKEKYVEAKSYNRTLFMHILRFSIRAKAIPEWQNRISSVMDSEEFMYLDTLSKVFNTRGMSVMFYQYKDGYVIIQSTSDADYNYNFLLSCMLMDCKDDADFVRRAAHAIQTKSVFEFTDEELKIIDDAIAKEKINNVYKIITSAAKNPKLDSDIITAQDKMRESTDEVLKWQHILRELQLKQFAISVGLTALDEKKEEILEYLSSIVDKILDFKFSGGNLYFTIQSVLRIPETDLDFFKPEAIENNRHALHGRPHIVTLLLDVINNKVRLPIRATYRFSPAASDSSFVCGRTDLFSSNAMYIPEHSVTNEHINNYDCFAGYKRMLKDAYNDMDFIGLFEILQQCTGTINVFDSIVFYRIVNSIEAMASDAPIQIKTDNGWETIMLGGYYEKIETRTE